MKLTFAAARDALPGAVLLDETVRGLQLEAKAQAKVFTYYYRSPITRQRRRPKIGEWPSLSLEDAREIAREWARRIARGEDPSEERTAARAAPTVSELGDLYVAHKEASGLKPRSVDEIRRHIKLHINPALGRRKVADATQADVNVLLHNIAKHAPPTANRVRDTLSGMFNFAEHPDNKWRAPNTNPARGDVVSFTERKRRRHVRSDEFVAIAKALDDAEREEPRHVAVIRCSLFCGSRITELIEARKDQYSRGRIVLDEHKTERTGDERVITVPRQAAAVIAALEDDGSTRLFGCGFDRFGVGRVWDKVREAAGCPDLQLRDLRRTFASVGKSKGIGLDAIGDLFGHKDPKTTRRYAWLFDEAETEAAQSIADQISAHMNSEKRNHETVRKALPLCRVVRRLGGR